MQRILLSTESFGASTQKITPSMFCGIETVIVLIFSCFVFSLQSVSAPVVNSCLSMLGNIKTEGGIILSKVKSGIVILRYKKQKELLKDLHRQSCTDSRVALEITESFTQLVNCSTLFFFLDKNEYPVSQPFHV